MIIAALVAGTFLAPSFQDTFPSPLVPRTSIQPQVTAPFVEISTGYATYGVVFVEKGLPAGTEWEITFAGITENSRGSEILFKVPNGTYSFSVGKVSLNDYRPSVLGGTFTVNGKSLTEGVSFISERNNSSPGTILLRYSPYIAVIAGIAIAAGLSLFFSRYSRLSDSIFRR